MAAASGLPSACYVDHDFFAVEQHRVFARSWVAVAPAAELRTGSVLVRRVGTRSVLLTRNQDGVPRAFLNSCRHRGTELAEADGPVGHTIRCPYHRWAYDLDGRLVATPMFADAGIDDFDPADFGLHAVAVDEALGLVFVHLEAPAIPLSDWLGDLFERFEGHRLGEWRERDRVEVEIGANWKLIAENFQEHYHLTWVHPELAKVSRVADHYRFQGAGMYCGQTTTPVSADERDDWSSMPAAAGLSRSDADSGRFVSIFPNVLLSVLPNHAFVMLLRPVGPDRTVETCVWSTPPTTAAHHPGFDVTRQFWLDVNAEDIDIVERSQRGLACGGDQPGRLSPRFEEPLHRFHNMLADRFVGVDRVPEGDPADDLDLHGSGRNPNPWHRR